MNGTHLVLVYADDVNLIDDIRTIERNADVLLNACKDIGLAVLTPWLLEPGGSMPHSQWLSNNSYPEPNQSSSLHS